MRKIRLLIVVALMLLGARTGVTQTRAPATRPQSSEEAEASYTQAIEKRVQEILDELKPADPQKRQHVHDAAIAQYRALRDWHDANDPTLKLLNKDAAANAAEIARIKATLKTLHDQYLARLGANLTTDQIDIVKDKMTYGTLGVTYNAYCQMLPNLTDAQRETIRNLLVQAREEAMDDGSSDEKHATFNRYKGKINNYLSKEKIDVGKASREWQARLKAGEKS